MAPASCGHRRPHRPPSSTRRTGGLEAFPQGSIAPQVRAASDPWHGRRECDAHSLPGQFFDKERGVACSPDPGPEIHRGRSTIATGRTRIVLTGTNISTKKRGVYLVAYESGSGSGPAGVHSARESGQCRAWPGTPGRPAMFVGDTPFPGRMTRSDRRGRPARPLRGGGRPDGGAPGRRSKVLYVPFAAPPSAARGPGPRHPVRSKLFYVPAATPFDSGLPANLGCAASLGCAARGDVHCWRSHITRRAINDL